MVKTRPKRKRMSITEEWKDVREQIHRSGDHCKEGSCERYIRGDQWTQWRCGGQLWMAWL